MSCGALGLEMFASRLTCVFMHLSLRGCEVMDLRSIGYEGIGFQSLRI